MSEIMIAALRACSKSFPCGKISKKQRREDKCDRPMTVI